MFKEEIQELNPGRKIVLYKICPYIKDICMKGRCNAYAEHFETNIVTLEDKIAHQDIEFDWELDLKERGWKFNCGSKSNIGPDNQDSLYFKKQDEIKYGRCLI
jgi:hypothetical protein